MLARLLSKPRLHRRRHKHFIRPITGAANLSSSIPRSIIGSQPGMLDPSQRQRLLHFPTSTLSFASFNPRTASSKNDIPDLHKVPFQDELNTAKRVVIETGPNGESFWRFVPTARRDEGVTDEGLWPRCVDLCGELVLFSQDQWDIFKLDSFYECRVRAPPNPSTITISLFTAPPPSPNPAKKRQMAPLSPRLHTNPQQPSSLSEALVASSDEEDEVEDMIIDDPPLQLRHGPQYIVSDPATRTSVVIDTALDYDAASGTLKTEAADHLLEFIQKNELKVIRKLETHAHADHLTASQYLKSKLPGAPPVCIGARITQVQSNFAPFYGFDKSIFKDTFDLFLKDDDTFALGNLTCKVVPLPGHTPDHIGYIIGKAVFTGDSIFMPDVGSARVDFPGGNAKQLFRVYAPIAFTARGLYAFRRA